jgi:hypothetical protein
MRPAAFVFNTTSSALIISVMPELFLEIRCARLGRGGASSGTRGTCAPQRQAPNQVAKFQARIKTLEAAAQNACSGAAKRGLMDYWINGSRPTDARWGHRAYRGLIKDKLEVGRTVSVVLLVLHRAESRMGD